MGRSLRDFTSRRTFHEKIKLALWILVNKSLVRNVFMPTRFRKTLLRLFGARIGPRVILRSSVMIQFPWNIEIGADCWIGEHVWFINHEEIKLGTNVCISQRSIICSGGHDYRSTSLEYAHKPIEIKDGAWVCLDAKVLPGVTIGECSVVSAGEVARKSIPDYSILVGGEIRPIDPPK
jgi:putative colanic acid biosynthesis acetyltransferase WcaF